VTDRSADEVPFYGVVSNAPGEWWLVVGGWWLVVGGWWLVVGGWWELGASPAKLSSETVIGGTQRDSKSRLSWKPQW